MGQVGLSGVHDSAARAANSAIPAASLPRVEGATAQISKNTFPKVNVYPPTTLTASAKSAEEVSSTNFTLSALIAKIKEFLALLFTKPSYSNDEIRYVKNEVRTQPLETKYSKNEFAIQPLGTDLEVRDEHGKTALMRAVAEGNLSEVENLIIEGANINAKDTRTGETALILAVKLMSDKEKEPQARKLIDFLHKEGADANIKDNSGRSAIRLSDQWREDKEISSKHFIDLPF